MSIHFRVGIVWNPYEYQHFLKNDYSYLFANIFTIRPFNLFFYVIFTIVKFICLGTKNYAKNDEWILIEGWIT